MVLFVEKHRIPTAATRKIDPAKVASEARQRKVFLQCHSALRIHGLAGFRYIPVRQCLAVVGAWLPNCR